MIDSLSLLSRCFSQRFQSLNSQFLSANLGHYKLSSNWSLWVISKDSEIYFIVSVLDGMLTSFFGELEAFCEQCSDHQIVDQGRRYPQ